MLIQVRVIHTAVIPVISGMFRILTVLFTANPDIVEKPITADHEFMILACDGIWDVLSNQEVVDFVRARIAQRMEPECVS